MSTKLEVLLGQIHPSRTLDRVAARVDRARTSFRCEKAMITDFDEYMELTGRFYARNEIRARVHDYWQRFVQRTDLYPQQLEGGGYTVVRRTLTDDIVRKHLEGEFTLGLYSTPDSTTRWLCLDVDATGGKAIPRLWQRLDRCRIPHLTEYSGRKGYHIWVFFACSVANRLARALGKALTREHEVFPKQDHIPEGGVGSLVKAPLGIHRATGRRCLFLYRDLKPLLDQKQALVEVRAITPV